MERNEFLTEWAVNYLKHKDSFTKTIQHIEDAPLGKRVVYKEKRLFLLVEPEDISLAKSDHALAVFLHTPSLVKRIVGRWSMLVSFQHLKVIGVNPVSSREKYWVVAPAVHARVADPDSLEKGIAAAAELVDTITDKDFALVKDL